VFTIERVESGGVFDLAGFRSGGIVVGKTITECALRIFVVDIPGVTSAAVAKRHLLSAESLATWFA
jgi:hypothetical protein